MSATLLDLDADTVRQFNEAHLADERARSDWMASGPAVTVYRDGTYVIWKNGDAKYAANEPDWLVSIYSDEFTSVAKPGDHPNAR